MIVLQTNHGDITIALNHSMSTTLFESFFWKQGRVTPAIYNPCALLTRTASQLIPNKGIPSMQTNTNDVSLSQLTCVKWLERFIA